MKNLLYILILAGFSGCYRYIDSGHVGVKVNASGTDKGIDPKPIGVGRAWYNPITEDVHEFPVYEQNVVWQKKKMEQDNLMSQLRSHHHNLLRLTSMSE